MTEVDAVLGFSADERGRGVAYARLAGERGDHLLRVGFRLRRGYVAREVGYAALTAVAQTLHRRAVPRVRFIVEDELLVRDVHEHSELPPEVVLAYVKLKCALNRFDGFVLDSAEEGDLTQRARAEIALNSVA